MQYSVVLLMVCTFTNPSSGENSEIRTCEPLYIQFTTASAFSLKCAPILVALTSTGTAVVKVQSQKIVFREHHYEYTTVVVCNIVCNRLLPAALPILKILKHHGKLLRYFQRAHFIHHTHSGCGKRGAHINWSMVMQRQQSLLELP